MSSPLAIAAVSWLLEDLLNEGVLNSNISTAGNVKVLAQAPLREPEKLAADASRLHVFLYQVTPNQGWRNAGLPTYDSNGTRVSNSPLALNLHYLVVAYSTEDLISEVLLGYAMHLLHEHPVLTRDQIASSLTRDIDGTTALPAELQKLSGAGLADQVESIKITPHFLNTDEMSKLWTGLQAPYRPSVAYLVTVVLIQSTRRVRATLPVTSRNVLAVPFRSPVLREIVPPFAPSGAPLTLRGSNLRGDNAEVFFDNLSVQPDPLGNDEAQVVPPAALKIGMHTVQMKHQINFGAADPHKGFSSNIVAFMLTPTISPVAPATEFEVPAAGGILKIGVSPAITWEQKVELLAGDRTIPLPAREKDEAPLTELPFTLPAGMPDKLVLRLRVDGADSALSLDKDTRQIVGPLLKVT